MDPEVFAFLQEVKGWAKTKPALEEGGGFQKDVVVHKELRALLQGFPEKLLGSFVVGSCGIDQGIDGRGVKEDRLLPRPRHGVRKRVGDPLALKNPSR